MRASAGRLDFGTRRFEALGPPRDEPDVRPLPREGASGGSADTRRRTGDDDSAYATSRPPARSMLFSRSTDASSLTLASAREP